LKLQISPAYHDYLANVPSPLSTSVIATKAKEKLIAELPYIGANPTGRLAKCMYFLTKIYTINNVALLITGALHERDTRDFWEYVSR